MVCTAEEVQERRRKLEETLQNARGLVDTMYSNVKLWLNGRDETIMEVGKLKENSHQIHQQGLWEKRWTVGVVAPIFVAAALAAAGPAGWLASAGVLGVLLVANSVAAEAWF